MPEKRTADRAHLSPGEQVEKLDALYSTLRECRPTEEAEFAQEHIREARAYVLGAMPKEYALNLDLMWQTLPRLRKTEWRDKVQTILEDLSQ